MMPSVHLFGEHRISGLILFGGHLVQSADNSWPRALHPSPGIFVELSDNSETGLLVLLDSLLENRSNVLQIVGHSLLEGWNWMALKAVIVDRENSR